MKTMSEDSMVRISFGSICTLTWGKAIGAFVLGFVPIVNIVVGGISLGCAIQALSTYNWDAQTEINL